MLLAMCFLPQCVAAAQSQTRGRVVTRDEGQEIVDAISERRPFLDGMRAKPDCSHLVNDVYSAAGFPYLYAKSSDLYGGHPNFVRVKFPQVGDLIVWRGHVGLVTDPQEHLFYSSLRSGLDIEDYTSAYWLKHGTPRFYRYRVSDNEPNLLARSNMRERDQEPKTSFSALSVKRSTRAEQAENSLTDDSPSTASEPSSGSIDLKGMVTAGIRPRIPDKIFIATGRDRPTVRQVNGAMSQLDQSTFPGLDAESLLWSPSTLIIFRHLQVERLMFKGKRGWVYITVTCDATWKTGIMDKTACHDEERWEIDRAKSGWTVSVPLGNVYLPRAVAVRIFAQQLARLTDTHKAQISNSVASPESDLATLLNGLLNP